MKRLFAAFFALLLTLFVSPLWTIAAPPPETDRVPAQILVKFKAQTSQAVIDAQFRSHNAKVTGRVAALDVLVVGVSQATEDRVITALSKNPNVEYAEPDGLAFVSFVPNDPYFAANQWGLENTAQTIKGTVGTVDADINAPTAWDITTGSAKVAILDTGIDQAHPDLSSKIDFQQNFTDSSSVDDFYGHGTHVSGIVAATTNNGTGVAGVCPNCRLLNVKVLNDSGSGAYSWISNGIIWATNNGAKVINMSLGGSVKSTTLEKAVNYAWNHGVVVVAAAGNSASPSKTYPGAYTNAIAVASTNNLDRKSSFSSYSAKWIDIAAPGENIFSTFPTHPYKINKSQGYDFGSGTSMATPMVSGTAALIWSTGYGTSVSSVRNRLESTADKIPGTGTYWSAGRIDAAAAVAP